MSLVREPGEESLPGYRLIEPLGSGGFGEVWKCEAPGGIFKAIKFVFGNLNSLDMDGARADQELKALNRVKEIRHPFILSMDRIEIVEGELLIVMELADQSLHDAYEECLAAGLAGIPRDTLLGYIRDGAEALDHMNEKHGLQHLDIKPRNLFLISNHVKVADFGLVKHLERSGMSGVLGGVTPLYAAPETFSGQISNHSDQYSLAIVYQELLTGQRPFNGKNPRQLAQQHLEGEPDLRSLPEAERPVVARALEDPSKRFPNCLAFFRALYNARAAARPSPGQLERIDDTRGTILDSMEDLLLDAGEDDAVALGGPRNTAEASSSQEHVSALGMTMSLPQTGSLRPTIVIGVGSFGRRALVECAAASSTASAISTSCLCSSSCTWTWTPTRSETPSGVHRRWRSRTAKCITCRCNRSPTIAGGSWNISANGCRAKSCLPCRARSRRRVHGHWAGWRSPTTICAWRPS